MPFGKGKVMRCAICNVEFDHAKRLSNHIKKHHKMTSQEYTIKYFYDGKDPACPVCGALPRFVAIGEYKTYCQEHAKEAMSTLGSVGGSIKKTWNKGHTKETDDRISRQAEKLSGAGNPFYGMKHSDESIAKISESKRLEFCDVVDKIQTQHPTLIVESSKDDYKTQNSLLTVRCSECSSTSEVSFFNLQRCWRCRTCNPIGSHQQLEVLEYVRSFGVDVKSSVRNVIAPLEIDVWVPDKNVAIEYHGLFWHSGGKNVSVDKRSHRRKFDACQEKGIKLLQIFSDEWREKNDVCRSMIRNALGYSSNKVNARDCKFVEVSSIETQPFLQQTHLQGSTRAKHHFALQRPNGDIIAVATLRIPIQKKYGENMIELARLAFAPDTSVRGGASKLLTNIKRALQGQYSGIISYADLMHGTGNVYEQCGLNLAGEATSLNYWYTDGVSRFDRFKFRAQGGSSEKEVALAAGVRQVFGCGNRVYTQVW